MKSLMQTLKSGRCVELLLLCALLCVLLLLMMDGREAVPDDDARMERILSEIVGAGKVHVMISGEAEPEGVVVLAEGADDISVMLALQRSVQALTGLPLEKIEIIKSG